MARETVTKVERFSVDIPNQPGEGAKLLEALKAEGVNLIACWGYPLGEAGVARMELVPSDPAVLQKAAKRAKVKLTRLPVAFHVVGLDRPGSLAAILSKLAERGVNVHALQAISVGSRYACLIQVDAKDVRKAAAALGV